MSRRCGVTDPLNRAQCAARDAADPLRECRGRFDMPPGLVYLDGNSLGMVPKTVPDRVMRTVADEWGKSLISSWNVHGWAELQRKTGDRIARLVGAPPGSIVAGDTISINLFKVLGAALRLRPDRNVILTDDGNFPSDLYVAQGMRDFVGRGIELRIVAPEDVIDAVTDDVAAIMLTEVDYRTARRHDMAAVTRRAHDSGALAIWDLAHSAGAIAVSLTETRADFAVGCTYKYLNGGPGAPGFLYVRPDLQDASVSPLAGWWGHAAPFAFEPEYRPASGIARMQCGTQPIIALAALDAALDVWDGVDLAELERKSAALCQLFIALVEARCGRHGLKLAAPREMQKRGSHVSFHCPNGYAVMQALIATGVVGDFRAPDVIRFGFAPLYNSYCDVWDAADRLAGILDTGRWNDPAFLAVKAVT